jgi:hypothetical protein
MYEVSVTLKFLCLEENLLQKEQNAIMSKISNYIDTYIVPFQLHGTLDTDFMQDVTIKEVPKDVDY